MSNLLEKSSLVLTPTAYDNGKILSVKPTSGIGDFDFTRNSSATRVNSQGLIEDMQILSSNLVSNGDFSQEGSELITNGDFENNIDGWISYSSTSTWDNGTIKTTATSDRAWIRQNSAITSNKSYKVTFKAKSSNISPNIKIYNGATFLDTGLSFDLVDTYKEFTYYLFTTTTNIIIGQQGLSVGDTINFDNVSVKEVGQDWTLGTGWSIGDGEAIATGASNSNLEQVGLTISNTKKYKISFTVDNYTSGAVRPMLGAVGAVAGTYVSENGTFTETLTANNNFDRIVFRTSGSGTTLSITNLSVIEITDDTNLPRIDYTDGVGSWLFEPQSTNLLTYSEDLTQGSLNRLLLTSNTNTSPDGTNTADKLIPNNTNSGYHYFAFSSLTIATNNVYSVFLKKAEYEYALISFETSGLSGSSDKALINLNNGTIEQSDTETKVEDYGNGWYRCSIKATSSRTSVVIYPLASASLGSFTGDNVSGILAWGLQLEQNSFATSYIPTNGSTVTRLADAAFGAGSSDLINSTEGVLYAEISALANYNTQRWFSLSDGTHSNAVKIGLANSATDFRFAVEVRSANSTQAFMTYNFGAITPIMTKVAIKFKQNDFALWVNGVKVSTDTSGNVPTGLNELSFDRGNGVQYFFGKTKCVAVFKEALTDEELTCLTTI